MGEDALSAVRNPASALCVKDFRVFSEILFPECVSLDSTERLEEASREKRRNSLAQSVEETSRDVDSNSALT